jgi:hypothetical protein
MIVGRCEGRVVAGLRAVLSLVGVPDTCLDNDGKCFVARHIRIETRFGVLALALKLYKREKWYSISRLTNELEKFSCSKYRQVESVRPYGIRHGSLVHVAAPRSRRLESNLPISIRCALA